MLGNIDNTTNTSQINSHEGPGSFDILGDRLFHKSFPTTAIDAILSNLYLRDAQALACLSTDQPWANHLRSRILSHDIFQIDLHLLTEISVAFIQSISFMTKEEQNACICKRANHIGQELCSKLACSSYSEFEASLSRDVFGSNDVAFAKHLLQFYEFSCLSHVSPQDAYKTYKLVRQEINILPFSDRRFFSYTQTFGGNQLVLIPAEFGVKETFVTINFQGMAIRTLPHGITNCTGLQTFNVKGTHITFETLTNAQKKWIYHLIHHRITARESFIGLKLPEHYIAGERTKLELFADRCDELTNSQAFERTGGTCQIV